MVLFFKHTTKTTVEARRAALGINGGGGATTIADRGKNEKPVNENLIYGWGSWFVFERGTKQCPGL